MTPEQVTEAMRAKVAALLDGGAEPSHAVLRELFQDQMREHLASTGPMARLRVAMTGLYQLPPKEISDAANRGLNEAVRAAGHVPAAIPEGRAPKTGGGAVGKLDRWLDTQGVPNYPTAPRRTGRTSSVVTPWDEAEHRAAEFLRTIGQQQVKVTTATQDDGVDILTAELVAQVKHHSGPVGGPVVQQIIGAAALWNRQAACFALSGYTQQALRYGQSGSVALFSYTPSWRYTPLNALAREIVRRSAN